MGGLTRRVHATSTITTIATSSEAHSLGRAIRMRAIKDRADDWVLTLQSRELRQTRKYLSGADSSRNESSTEIPSASGIFRRGSSPCVLTSHSKGPLWTRPVAVQEADRADVVAKAPPCPVRRLTSDSPTRTVRLSRERCCVSSRSSIRQFDGARGWTIRVTASGPILAVGFRRRNVDTEGSTDQYLRLLPSGGRPCRARASSEWKVGTRT